MSVESVGPSEMGGGGGGGGGLSIISLIVTYVNSCMKHLNPFNAESTFIQSTKTKDFPKAS